MEGDERLRLFCALLLPASALDVLERWQIEAFDGARVRPVASGNLHVTLAFLGSTPKSALPAVVSVLGRAADGVGAPVLVPARYRETRSVGMIVLADAAGRATRLAERLGARLEEIGVYEREARAWLPHVTVARFRERPRLTLDPPPLGEVRTSDAAVMISRLRPGGAQYEVLETVSLGG